MKSFFFKLAMLGVVLSSPYAEAGVFNYSGDTMGGLTWNRPIEGNPPTLLSAVGTAVPFSAFQFKVDASGDYSFEVLATNSFDPNLFLYQGSFNPNTPLASVIDGNDDLTVTNPLSKFSHTLTAGTSYYLVTTGFDNASSGKFNNEISGVGNIAAVPEPEEWAMMIVGAALVSFQVRRKAKGTAS